MISDHSKFIFVHNLKTGGSSIKQVLSRHTEPGYRKKAVIHKLAHLTAEKMRDYVGQEKWDDYATMTVIREPRDRTVSLYHETRRGHRKHYGGKRPTFLMWLERLRGMDRKDHWNVPQRRFAYGDDGRKMVKDVLSFSDLSWEFAEWAKREAVEAKPIPHKRRSKGRRMTSRYYGPVEEEIVREVYAEDFAMWEEMQAAHGVLLKVGGGGVLCCHHDDHITRMIRKKKQYYEAPEINRLIEIGGMGGHWIDVGANIGNHTVALCVLGKAARVDSFEPCWENRALLRKNVDRNGLADKVVCHPVALGHVPTTVTVEPCHGNMGATRVVESRSGSVDVRPLDSYFFDEPLAGIKVDAEGWDTRVLFGAQKTIERCQPRCVMVEVQDHELQDAGELLDSYERVYLGGRRGSHRKAIYRRKTK